MLFFTRKRLHVCFLCNMSGAHINDQRVLSTVHRFRLPSMGSIYRWRLIYGNPNESAYLRPPKKSSHKAYSLEDVLELVMPVSFLQKRGWYMGKTQLLKIMVKVTYIRRKYWFGYIIKFHYHNKDIYINIRDFESTSSIIICSFKCYFLIKNSFTCYMY